MKKPTDGKQEYVKATTADGTYKGRRAIRLAKQMVRILGRQMEPKLNKITLVFTIMVLECWYRANFNVFGNQWSQLPGSTSYVDPSLLLVFYPGARFSKLFGFVSGAVISYLSRKQRCLQA